jgi:hypothetical protein
LVEIRTGHALDEAFAFDLDEVDGQVAQVRERREAVPKSSSAKRQPRPSVVWMKRRDGVQRSAHLGRLGDLEHERGADAGAPRCDRDRASASGSAQRLVRQLTLNAMRGRARSASARRGASARVR